MDLLTLEELTHYDHSRKVSAIAGMLARRVGFSVAEAAIIEQAALYHDVGKIDIPVAILKKPSALTPQEFSQVKNHTSHGHKRISEAARVLAAADIIASFHHERWNGTGYYGLSGEDIPEYARIVAIADVYDALVSKRPYKDSWDGHAAMEYLAQNAGTQFDAEYVRALIDLQYELPKIYTK